MGQEKMRLDETRLETKSSLESLESPESPDKTCLVRSMRALLWILLMNAEDDLPSALCKDVNTATSAKHAYAPET